MRPLGKKYRDLDIVNWNRLYRARRTLKTMVTHLEELQNTLHSLAAQISSSDIVKTSQWIDSRLEERRTRLRSIDDTLKGIRSFLSKVPAEERKVATMMFRHEKPGSHVAQHLGIPYSKVLGIRNTVLDEFIQFIATT